MPHGSPSLASNNRISTGEDLRRSPPPTLLYDEIDIVYGPKAKGNEELRAVLNAGHRRGATAGPRVSWENNALASTGLPLPIAQSRSPDSGSCQKRLPTEL